MPFSMRDTWFVGDIHGCKKTFFRLLEAIGPSESTQIVLLGDLINRGPESAQILDFVMKSSLNIKSILGNHDLAFIAYFHKIFKNQHPQDSYQFLSEHPHALEWINWLRQCPFYFEDSNCLAVHAGFYPFWTLEKNITYAQSLSQSLQSEHYVTKLEKLWAQAHLETDARCPESFALNVFTRMRYLNSDKSLCLSTKGLLALSESEKIPWFSFWPVLKKTLIFGHWSALKGQTNRQDIICLDTGCVWKESLSAYHSQTGKVITEPWREDS